MPLSTHDFHYVRELVLRRSAIVIDESKAYLVDMRLDGLSRDEKVTDTSELVARSRSDSRLQTRIVESMTTNETSFFRDVHPFAALKESVLPDFIARRAASRELVIWCAASSTGQEPYSIAMVMREHFPEICAHWSVKILATDISTPTLERAREGVYRQLEVSRGVPAPMLARYFEKRGVDWVIRPEVRRMVEFRHLNLILPWGAMPRPDIVFIRNVLIYFDLAVKRDILDRIRKVMAPDGYLLLGGAETTIGVHDGYARASIGGSVAYRPTEPKAQAVSFPMR